MKRIVIIFLQLCLAARPWPADELHSAKFTEDNNDSAAAFSINAAENDHEAAKASELEMPSRNDAENLLRHVFREKNGNLDLEECP